MEQTSASAIRSEVDAIMKKAGLDHQLLAGEKERFHELADTGDPWARYQYARYLTEIENRTDDGLEIWKALAQEQYAPAMEKMGDICFRDNAPEHWDLAYNYYTGEGAAALTDERKIAVKDILNHGKYNKRVLIMSIVFCAVSVFFMLLTGSFAVYHINAVLRIIFIALEAAVVVQGIRIYRYNSFSSLRWMLPDLLLIWSIYLFIWLM